MPLMAEPIEAPCWQNARLLRKKKEKACPKAGLSQGEVEGLGYATAAHQNDAGANE
jgi:hypothetical protein